MVPKKQRMLTPLENEKKSAMINEEENVYLDFDGVICDSAREAFTVLSRIGKLKKTEENYKYFYQLRKKVGPAWNYYYVLRELKGKKKEEWIESIDSKKFQKEFFKTRDEVSKEMGQKYFELSNFYKNYEILNNIESIIILTNKNKIAVQELIDRSKLKNVIDIISMPESGFNEKFEYLKIKKKCFFIDDHYGTIEKVTRNCPNVTSYQAAWGYSEKLHKKNILVQTYEEVEEKYMLWKKQQ